jgi:transposase InsO family protein
MKLARSTYYYRSRRSKAEKKVLQHRIAELSAEFPRYGYRRVTHQLPAEGLLVNHKAVARIMRQHGLQVRPLRRFVRTTQSDSSEPHLSQPGAGPSSNRTRPIVGCRPDLCRDLGRLRVRRRDTRSVVAPGHWLRNPQAHRHATGVGGVRGSGSCPSSSDCIHHSDRGAQGGFKRSSQYLDRGNWDDY